MNVREIILRKLKNLKKILDDVIEKKDANYSTDLYIPKNAENVDVFMLMDDCGGYFSISITYLNNRICVKLTLFDGIEKIGFEKFEEVDFMLGYIDIIYEYFIGERNEISTILFDQKSNRDLVIQIRKMINTIG